MFSGEITNPHQQEPPQQEIRTPQQVPSSPTISGIKDDFIKEQLVGSRYPGSLIT